MVSVLRDWKTLALIEVRDSKYFVCHPKITPCSTGINPKQAFACFQSKHAQEQSCLYIDLCMGKTSTCQAFYQVYGKMISVASFLQKLITKSCDPISFQLNGPRLCITLSDRGIIYSPFMACMGKKLELGQDKDHGLRSDKRHIRVSQHHH